jgi:hypothetical protein
LPRKMNIKVYQILRYAREYMVFQRKSVQKY